MPFLKRGLITRAWRRTNSFISHLCGNLLKASLMDDKPFRSHRQKWKNEKMFLASGLDPSKAHMKISQLNASLAYEFCVFQILHKSLILKTIERKPLLIKHKMPYYDRWTHVMKTFFVHHSKKSSDSRYSIFAIFMITKSYLEKEHSKMN